MFSITSSVLIVLVSRVLGEECVTYDFESDLNEILENSYLSCNSLPNWNVGLYSDINMLPPNPNSNTFIYPLTTTSCISSLPFVIDPAGTVEVNVYMDSVSLNDEVMVIIQYINPGGNDVGMASGTLSSKNGLISTGGLQTIDFVWNSQPEEFEGYLLFLGNAAEGSTIFIDSYRYIPPSSSPESCSIYDEKEEFASTTTEHIETTQPNSIMTTEDMTTDDGTSTTLDFTSTTFDASSFEPVYTSTTDEDNKESEETTVPGSNTETNVYTTESVISSTIMGSSEFTNEVTEITYSTDYETNIVSTENTVPSYASTSNGENFETTTIYYTDVTNDITDTDIIHLSTTPEENFETTQQSTTELVTTDSDENLNTSNPPIITTDPNSVNTDETSEPSITEPFVTGTTDKEEIKPTTENTDEITNTTPKLSSTVDGGVEESITVPTEESEESETNTTTNPVTNTTENPTTPSRSFWNPLTIGAVVLISLIILCLVCWFFYECGARKAKGADQIILVEDYNELPQPHIVPRVKKIYTDNPYSRKSHYDYPFSA